MARAPVFTSRHAENVILMARAPPAAHGRREQVAPLQHLLGCGQLEDVKKCCGGRTFSCKNERVFCCVRRMNRTHTRSNRAGGTHMRSTCFCKEHVRVLSVFGGLS